MASHPFPVSFRACARWAALAAACGLFACMDLESAAGPRPVDESASVRASQEKQTGRPGVPSGCTREWNSETADSVLNCPDVRPPGPPVLP